MIMMWKLIVAAVLAVLTIVSGTLKLSGTVIWPWWMVLAPLYPIVAWGVFFGVGLLLMMWVFRDGM